MDDDQRPKASFVRDYPGSALLLACIGPAAISVSVAYLDDKLFIHHEELVAVVLLANLLIATAGAAAIGWVTQTKPADKPKIAIAMGVLGIAGYTMFTLSLYSLLPIGIRH